MTAQEYYQRHPQNTNSYPPPEPPPQYASPAPQFSAPQHRPSFTPSPRPPYPASPYLHPHAGTPLIGTPQPQPFQQQFLPPQHPQQQLQRPPFPPPIQTQQPYTQSQAHAPQAVPNHLRPTRSYSEPPSPRDYERHHRRHQSHDRRHRSPSPSSDSDSESRSRSRSRERRHRHSHRGSNASRDVDGSHERGYWADKARGKKDFRDKGHHSARNTFFGAFGGGAIGDLIAPGLGTLGGAILGGVGGHSAGRSRSGSSRDGGRGREGGRKRDRYDEEWEEGRRRRGEI